MLLFSSIWCNGATRAARTVALQDDIPPYVMFTSRHSASAASNPGLIEQLNIIGMLRSNIQESDMDALEMWYRTFYRTSDSKCFLKGRSGATKDVREAKQGSASTTGLQEKDWVGNVMATYYECRSKQKRQRPLAFVASGTPMHPASEVH